MNQWYQIAYCLCLVQASAFTAHRYHAMRKISDTTTPVTTLPRRGPMMHSSTTADQGESEFRARQMVDDTSIKSENVSPEDLDDTFNIRKDSTTAKAPKCFPWSEFNDWALRDNLPKYTRILPGDTPKTYALWRTMLQEVPELSGYPIQFLQEKYSSEPLSTKQKTADKSSSSKAMESPNVVPEILPFLDKFYFEPSGGLSGQVYGVPGLRDGTTIETTPVGQVEVTIPLGYVLTEDNEIAYEIGSPLQSNAGVEEDGSFYSLSGVTRKAGQAAGTASQVAASNMADMARQAATTNANSSAEPDETSAMLVKLGASTGLLLAGATAMSMLSHHLTVNVFWV